MTEAYKCDKCNEYTDDATEVGIGGGADVGIADNIRHVCDGCERKLLQWFSSLCEEGDNDE